jgi:hypothetical protein
VLLGAEKSSHPPPSKQFFNTLTELGIKVD